MPTTRKRKWSLWALLAVNLITVLFALFMVLLSLGNFPDLIFNLDSLYGFGFYYYRFIEFDGTAPILAIISGFFILIHLALLVLLFLGKKLVWYFQLGLSCFYLLGFLFLLVNDLRMSQLSGMMSYLGLWGLLFSLLAPLFLVHPDTMSYLGRFEERD